VGEKRRAHTREKILTAALHVFAEKGPVAPVIDDFIAAAEVARGTFYNYFQSTEELFDATAKWLEDDLIVSIVQAMEPLTNPVDRVTTGVRLWLLKASADSAWCAFIYRSRYRGALVEQELTRDLEAGRRSGAFTFSSTATARDFVVGSIHETMGRIMSGIAESELHELARMILLGLGLTESQARAALDRPLLPMQRPPLTLT
jgi:AcrR family transcriptional regulator